MKWYERLKIAREAKGLKKSHFARVIGVQPATITEWERGDTESPSSSNTLKICEALSITPAWLINGENPPKEKYKYEGTNAQIARAVERMETLSDIDLSQIIAIIETFSLKSKSQ
ncbi:MAG: helix-turn-helix transcriptional regulator [Undibacterium umbellatum]|uniref:helix-turn-helix domain-containing protein n=1 Tax=Undibacterium umbellatum TaxID=2762300 RepID=UPI003BB6FEE8